MKIRPFELALIIIFIVLAFTALILLANFQGDNSSDDGLPVVGSVTIWGTIPVEAMDRVLRPLREQNESYNFVTYRYYSPTEFDQQLVNALADDRGPDLVLTSHEKLVELRRRIQPLSYEMFPLPDIRARYIDGAEIYALADGFYALPMVVDPLMMYWNRDILTNEGFLEAPRTWEALVNDVFPEVIDRDFSRTVNRSVVAMGEYRNVRNGFGALSTLLLQSGSQMVVERNGEYSVQLQQSVTGGDPLRSVADFYTRFSQPNNSLYSWSRTMREDRQEFIAEDLALYFGYASEGYDIEQLNPNLNFAVAEMPQGAGATVRRTYGKFYGLSLLRGANNPNGAYAVMQHLGAAGQVQAIANATNMAPVYRTQVAAGSDDKYGRQAYQSAAISYGWLSPNRAAVDSIFTTMTSDINENRTSLTGAVTDVSGRLRDVY